MIRRSARWLPFLLAVLIVPLSRLLPLSSAGTPAESTTAPAPLRTSASASVAAGDSEESRAERLYARGLPLERSGALREAAAAYRRAFRADPTYTEAYVAYIDVKGWLWEGADARREMEMLRDRAPGSAVLHFAYAYATLGQNSNPGVLHTLFRRAVYPNADYAWPYAFLHATTVDRGRSLGETVVRDLRRCRRGGDSEAVEEICLRQDVVLSDRAWNFARAAAAAERALAHPAKRGRAELHAYLFEARARLGRWEAAFEAARRADRELSAAAAPWPRFRFLVELVGRIDELEEADAPLSARRRLDRWVERALPEAAALVERWNDPAIGARFLRHVASHARKTGKPGRAIAHLETAVRVAGRAPSGTPVSEVQLELCRYHRRASRYERALPHCEASAAGFRDDGDSVALMNALHDRMHTLEGLGRLERARPLAEEILRLARTVGAESQRVSALHDVGWLAWKLGDYQRARPALDEMVGIIESEGQWFYEAGELYEKLGDYDRALDFYHRGAADTTGASRSAWGNYGRSVHALSRLYLELGRLERARRYGIRYDRYLRSSGRTDMPLSELPAIYAAQGRHAEAVREARRALDHAREIDDRGLTADARFTLGTSYLQADRPRAALELLRTALEEYRGLGRFWDVTDALLAVGQASLSAARPGAALAYADTARAHARRARAPDQAWRAEYLRGRALERLGSTERARAAYRRAIGQVEKLRSRIHLEQARSWFLADRFGPYDALVASLLEPSPDGGSPTLGVLAEVFEVVERRKVRVLIERLPEPTARSNQADGTLGQALHEGSVHARLEAARARLQRRLQATDPDAGASSEVRSLQATVDRLAAERARIARRLNADGEISRIRTARPLDLQAARKLLTADQAIVEYAFIEGRLLALVLRRSGIAARWLSLNESEATRLVDSLRAPIEALARGEISLTQVAWDLGLARDLHLRLIGPLKADLRNVRELLIVPEGPLWRLPFGALATGGRAAGGENPRAPSVSEARGARPDSEPLLGEYEGIGFLLDRFLVSYLPGVTLYHAQTRFRVDGEGFLAFTGTTGPGATPAGGRLPGAGAEVRSGRGHFPHGAVLTGGRATEEAYRTKAGRRRVIHFATHAAADPGSPLRSSLLLTAGPSSDGRLHSYEIATRPLRADLVVLSACGTGTGPLLRGEGVLSLARSFLAAGARSVVATLWPVPDRAGRVVTGFYRRHLGGGVAKAAALSLAKRELKSGEFELPDGRRVSMAHPLFWAGYVLLGDPDSGAKSSSGPRQAQADGRRP